MVICLLLIVCLRVCYLTYHSWLEVRSTELRCDASDEFFGWVDDHEHKCIPCSTRGSLLLRQYMHHYLHWNHVHRWQPDQELLELIGRAMHTHTCRSKRRR